jgi:hypothetical protein
MNSQPTRSTTRTKVTVFVSASEEVWQIVSRQGVAGSYKGRADAIADAMELARQLSATQVLAQNQAGIYERVWPQAAH